MSGLLNGPSLGPLTRPPLRKLALLCCLAGCALLPAQEIRQPIAEGWEFRQVGQKEWHTARVPGVVHTDLMHHGLIPDPYYGSNVDSVQWVELEDWEYRTTITVDEALLRHTHIELTFKGLDTFSEIFLNDSLLGATDNMFRTWSWSVAGLLKPGGNLLRVIFRSPIRQGALLRDQYGIQLPHDSDPSAVSPYIRKAAYHFGWDLAPRLVTSGIWQPVELHGWSGVRFMDAKLKQGGTNTPHLELTADLIGQECLRGHLKVYLNDTLVRRHKLNSCGARSQRPTIGPLKLRKGQPRQWWPRGHGEQALYDLRLEFRMRDGGEAVYTGRYGFREALLVQQKDSIGTSFSFVINGTPVFAKGCNLVPPDMFLPRSGDSAWVALVKHMVDASMNMVRIWAGGVYPPEAFFEACDSAGIMVWQDLMFATMVPGEGAFQENAMAEIIEQAKRITHHPSVVVLCGNNELDVAWKNWGWQKRYGLHGADSARVWNAHLRSFHQQIPKALGEFNYTPTSPLSNWGLEAGSRHGSLHYWGVWHGDSSFASFRNNVGRFITEYGFQSWPDSAMLARYIPASHLRMGSTMLNSRQRSYKGNAPILVAIDRELGFTPTSLDEFCRASQTVQAMAYGTAIQAHWAAFPHCMGTLLWQLNDVWPGPSWSLIDHLGGRKEAFHRVSTLYKAIP